jgi:molecular chaperone HtpG
MTEQHRFQVNLRGVVELLAKHLYSKPELFLRELLQNAVDAVSARKALEPAYTGNILIEVNQRPGGHAALTMIDDGIGMNEAELHRFLATIGESSKRASNIHYLGQFGIGLLAGFMVSDEIVAVSKSARDDTPAVEWRGNPDGTYGVRVLSEPLSPGTRVSLVARRDCVELFAPERIQETALHYGRLLPYPIRVVDGSSGGDGEIVNARPAPWRAKASSKKRAKAALLEFGRQVLQEDFLDAVPLTSAIGGVDGAAFVLSHPVSLSAQTKHLVYLKNMLLSDEAEGLLPDWAFFVKAVVNVESLRPTASRESFYNDERLEATREELGQELRSYLMALPETDPKLFERFMAVHHLAIKALAADDDDCLRTFVDWLPYETTQGTKTIRELRESGDVIRYTAEIGQYHQIAKIARSQGMLVVNAGYVYEADILARLGDVFPECTVQPVDVARFSADLEEPSAEELEQAEALLEAATAVLKPLACIPELRRFDPAEVPALFAADGEARFMRSLEQAKETSDPLFSGILASISSSRRGPASAMLYLNIKNPLVRRIAAGACPRVCERCVEILYVESLLLAQQPITSRELDLLSHGVAGLLDAALAE